MARSFDGASGNIQFNTSGGQEGLTTVSFSIWIYRSGGGEGGYGRMFGHSSTTTDKYKFENDNADAGWGLSFIAGRTTTNGVWSVGYPTNNTWTHYIITYDGSSTTNDPIIYKNGTSVTVTERSTPSGTLQTTDEVLTIGNHQSDVVTWNGRLAEFGMWNKILTAGEALGLGKVFSPRFYPNGLVLYSDIGGNASPERDWINGVAGTVTATTKADHPRIIYPTPAQIRKYGGVVTISVKTLAALGVG